MTENRPQTGVGPVPALFILLQSLLYGFGDPITKDAYAVMPVFSLLAVRYSIAFLALMLLFGRRVVRGLRSARPRDWLLPGVCIALTYILNNIALKLTAATSVAFLRSLSTVITPVMAFAVYRARYDRRHIPVQLAVAAGLYLLCGRGGLNGFGPGEAVTLLAACFMAGALVFGSRSLGTIDPITLTTAQAGMSALLAIAASFAFDGGVRVGLATPRVWAIILYLALACTLAGYLLQNLALRRIPARTVALLQCACPVMTAAFSRLLLGERLSAAGVVGAAIILACVAAESAMARHDDAAADEEGGASNA